MGHLVPFLVSFYSLVGTWGHAMTQPIATAMPALGGPFLGELRLFRVNFVTAA